MNKTKQCTKCKTEKEENKTNFRTRKVKSGRIAYRSQCKICERAYSKKWFANNKESKKASDKKYYVNNPEAMMLQRSLRRARKKGLEHDITVSDIEIPSVCPVLGITIKRNLGKKVPSYNSPSLDRLDPSLGYVKGNIKVISHRANTLKNDATLEEMERMVRFLKGIKGSGGERERGGGMLGKVYRVISGAIAWMFGR